jgi:neutral ceramidase
MADTVWRAGLAKVSITPRDSIWLDGWAGRTEPSHGVTQEIHAKALALSSSDNLLSVVVSCDLCGLTAAVIDSVTQFALKEYGIARSRLVLHVTHNHSGPRLSRDRGYFSDISYPSLTAEHWSTVDRYTVWLEQQIRRCIMQAVEDMAPARLRWGLGVAGIAANRRRDRDGPATRSRPLVVDQDVSVRQRALSACHMLCISQSPYAGPRA